MPAALNLATRKVGGIRFLKIGRLTLSVCLSREFRPFPARVAPSRRRRPVPGARVILMPVDVPMPDLALVPRYRSA